MNAMTESKFKPFESPSALDVSAAKVSTAATAAVLDSTEKDKASFKDVLLNSNDDMERQRAAQKNGDQLRMAKTDEEFAKMMTEKANQGNVRKPQNELDKDAFLKLFVTQMRNQDPLNPDNSAQMASQLAQFHGLEQMMNVNKNLEKMQGEEAMGRAVGLINFVGKEIKLDNGKLMMQDGKINTQASFRLEGDVEKASLQVRDASGAVVGTKELGHLAAGDHKLEWSGFGKDGKPIPNGAYSFSVDAVDDRAQTVGARITSTVKVTGVDLHDAGGSFYTELGKVRTTDVASVGEGGFDAGAKALAASAQKAAAGRAVAAANAQEAEAIAAGAVTAAGETAVAVPQIEDAAHATAHPANPKEAPATTGANLPPLAAEGHTDAHAGGNPKPSSAEPVPSETFVPQNLSGRGLPSPMDIPIANHSTAG